MMPEKEIYNRIKTELSKARKANKQLAEHLNVQQGTISRWVQNHAQPSIQQLFRIAKYLNISVYDLLEPVMVKVEE